MSEHHRKMLSSSLGVSFATLLSRLLGLVRVTLEASVLGGEAVATAWQLAFMIPNLFRRLLGEGVLGSALIPVITHTEERCGPAKVRRDLAVVFAGLGALLALIVAVVSLAAVLLRPLVATDYLRAALLLLPLTMPYALFMCFTGIIGSVLNSRRVFFLPALGALLLNFFLIGGLAAGLCRKPEPTLEAMLPFLETLAVLVLASGLTQLVLMLWLLKHYGCFPHFCRPAFADRGVIRELWRMVMYGMIGGAALQISFLADRLLAAGFLGPQAAPALANTDRVIDLPIGIFALSLGSVLMANMSRSAARGDQSEMSADLFFGLRLVYFICIPMAVFTVVFREPLLRMLLMHGKFTASDLRETTWAALFYGAGIPAFCSLKVILPAYYARKEMRKPVLVSLGCIAVNLVLNLILMWPLRQGGIALATVISSSLNNTVLLWMLRREGLEVPVARLAKAFGRALLAALPAALVWFLYPALCRYFCLPHTGEAVPFLIALGLFTAIYLGIGKLAGAAEPDEFFSLLRRSARRRSESLKANSSPKP